MLYSVTVPRLEVSCYVLPAAFESAGGDWCDVVSVDESHAVVVIGDVSGHGAAAAAIMDALRTLVRVFVGQGCAPQEILARCSTWLSADEDDHLATMICGCLDLESRELTVANAGHPQPLLLLDDSGEYMRSHVGPPCGTLPGGDYVPTTVELLAGTTLLAFTDGLVERRRRSIDWSLARLRAVSVACRSPSLEAQLEAIVATLLPDASDDAALLALRLPGDDQCEPKLRATTRNMG